jgi:thiamine-phosphate pyrophosphorylase
MKPLADCRLYAFVDAAYLDGRAPGGLAESLCLGGADLIQLRAKNWPRDRILATARELRPILLAHDVRLVINDHPDIARELAVGLCHLGREDFFGLDVRHVRDLGPPGLETGLSTHSPAQARAAITAGAAYIAVGPVHATPTKPEARPTGLDYVRWAAREVRIPWFAIGGIHLGNLDAILGAGARRVCVVSAILRAADPREACRLFKERLEARAVGQTSR